MFAMLRLITYIIVSYLKATILKFIKVFSSNGSVCCERLLAEATFAVSTHLDVTRLSVVEAKADVRGRPARLDILEWQQTDISPAVA
jgi:hypothetical protein